MTASKRRIEKELKYIRENPLPYCSVQPDPDDVDMCRWTASMAGPADSPYTGGVFHLTIHFLATYPMTPPKVKFVTKIYHPNIGIDGLISLDILQDRWSPALKIVDVLMSIYFMLNEPNPNDPMNPEAGHLCLSDHRRYIEKVQEWTQRYAHVPWHTLCRDNIT